MSIQPFINEKFAGNIWRLEIDEKNDTLFVESRNAEERKTNFSSINLQTGGIHFKDFIGPENWHTGIEAVYGNVLLLHLYESANTPVHKGLIAISALSGEILWQNYNLGMDHLSAEGPVVFDMRMQPRKLFLIDIKTGVSLSNANMEPKNLSTEIIFPGSIDLTLLPSELTAFNTCGKTAQYLKFNNLIFVSLHTFNGEFLSHGLFILDDQKIIFKEILNDQIHKMQPESFILFKNFLIYIKNKTELKVLNL